jgi:hypothetical protein
VGTVKRIALVACLVVSCLALAQTFPTDLAKTTPLPSRDALLSNLLTDPPLYTLSSVTLVGGFSPALFSGAEPGWNALFGWGWLPAYWRTFLPKPRLLVARSKVSSFTYLCNAARFEVYGVDRVPQGAFIILERSRNNPANVRRGVILGGLLDGTTSSATLYADEVFVNNLVVQFDLPTLIGRATRAC